MSRLILVLAVLLLIAAPTLAEKTIVLAHGDTLDFYGYETPTNQTENLRVWIFAGKDQFYGIDFTSNVNQYHIVIPDTMLNSIDVGKYTMYVQFPGPNKRFDVEYKNNRIRTIYREINDIDISAVTPDMVRHAFDLTAGTDPVDDVLYKYSLDVQNPMIRVKNMYTLGNGNLHIDAITNLAAGDEIRAIIDEETYQVPMYAEMMSYRTFVSGVENRTFSLEFTREVADQLPSSKTHVISVHFLRDGVTTIPFHRYERYVEPTPTQVIEYYYSFSGEMLGYDINTTPPAPSVTTIVPTITQKIYDTRLIETRLNNRTIEQRGIVYVGEKNLNIWGALGWEDKKAGYNFRVRWCDGDGEIIKITNPEHFDVDEETFRSRHGSWCQYNEDLEERHPPVAFIVRSNPGLNWTDGSDTIAAQNANRTVLQVNLSGILSNLTIYNTTEVTPTMPWETNESVNVTTVPTTEPTPIPTTETINLPLSPWVAIAGLVVVIVCRH